MGQIGVTDWFIHRLLKEKKVKTFFVGSIGNKEEVRI